MALSYNFGYQESISEHPTRRQIFAGKPDSTFPNIWEWLILMLIERTRGSSWQTHVICIYHLLRLHIWFVNSCMCVFGTDFPLNQLFLRHALEICGWNLNDLVWSYKWNKSILKSKERQRDLEQGCISLLVPLTHLLKVSYITFLSELRWYPVSSKTLYLEISRDIFPPILAVHYQYHKISSFDRYKLSESFREVLWLPICRCLADLHSCIRWTFQYWFSKSFTSLPLRCVLGFECANQTSYFAPKNPTIQELQLNMILTGIGPFSPFLPLVHWR